MKRKTFVPPVAVADASTKKERALAKAAKSCQKILSLVAGPLKKKRVG